MTSSALIQLDNQRKNQRQRWVLAVRGLGCPGEVFLDGAWRDVMSDVGLHGRITDVTLNMKMTQVKIYDIQASATLFCQSR